MGRHVLYTPNLSVSTPASFVAARHLKPFPARKERANGMRTINKSTFYLVIFSWNLPDLFERYHDVTYPHLI